MKKKKTTLGQRLNGISVVKFIVSNRVNTGIIFQWTRSENFMDYIPCFAANDLETPLIHLEYVCFRFINCKHTGAIILKDDCEGGYGQ